MHSNTTVMDIQIVNYAIHVNQHLNTYLFSCWRMDVYTKLSSLVRKLRWMCCLIGCMHIDKKGIQQYRDIFCDIHKPYSVFLNELKNIGTEYDDNVHEIVLDIMKDTHNLYINAYPL